jgi:hypothetical protein
MVSRRSVTSSISGRSRHGFGRTSGPRLAHVTASDQPRCLDLGEGVALPSPHSDSALDGCRLLVDNVTACAEPHTYRSVFTVDGTHPYLYENPAIANMGRQLLKAISHIYYDIPMDSRFALHGIDIEFLRWARIAVDIELVLACG